MVTRVSNHIPSTPFLVSNNFLGWTFYSFPPISAFYLFLPFVTSGFSICGHTTNSIAVTKGYTRVASEALDTIP
jgi:hypothetical protein